MKNRSTLLYNVHTVNRDILGTLNRFCVLCGFFLLQAKSSIPSSLLPPSLRQEIGSLRFIRMTLGQVIFQCMQFFPTYILVYTVCTLLEFLLQVHR